jgi:Ca2+/H+ antiporter
MSEHPPLHYHALPEVHMNKSTLVPWLKDTIERALATYVEAFVGILIASETFGAFGASTLTAALVSAIPAGLTVVKAALASRVGYKTSGSMLDRARGPVDQPV